MSKLTIPFSLIKSIIKSNKRLHKFLLKLEHSNMYIFNLFSIARNINVDINSIFKFVEIEICPLCNRKCSFCPISKDNIPKKLMSNQLFGKILSELKELNFNGDICLSSYGEPLLDKRLAGFAKRVKAELGSKIIIATNGDFLTIERFKELVSAGIDTIIVSQHDKEPSSTIKDMF
ncbi:radical SAM protein [Patescibacteria group bacterium]|nr:radical SAM protein [Patescibacteria group bacterium]MBU4078506.1 radical SAM protein [Patescibacteria group bacterium]